MFLISVLQQAVFRSMNTVKSATAGTPFLGGRVGKATVVVGLLPAAAFAQTAFSWQQIKDKFESTNPTLIAARLNIDESRAAEITAYLRPNPDFTLSADGTQLTPYGGIYRPFAGTQISPAISYLHEREQKRELRRDQAKESTAIAESSYRDQARGLLFNLQNAFVQVLQNKAFLQNARENLDYWDRELGVNRTRFEAGDLAQVDLDRLELQRVQFESDFETATVNVRTAKIQLLMLLNDRTPLERFEVDGPYDFADELKPLQDYRNIALEGRPDLKVAMQNVELAKITYKLTVANGSTDPTYSLWWTHNPSFNNPYDYNTIGASISIPLRIFDRNQGQKTLTQIDIGRNERLKDATEAQVFNEVDSAYYTIVQNVNLLKPYKTKYLKMATDVRDRMSFAFKNGGASLLDYLDAEKAYRDTRLAYVNLIGSYLTATAQMDMAVGREVLQ
ncbi:MAG: TolC family protein [Bryobacteraceae bacterium]|jgi:cobalt-zinc-cadmium efflux system outer membrane protein